MKETELLWRGNDGKDAKFREGKRREGEEVVAEAIDDELIKIKITVLLNPKGLGLSLRSTNQPNAVV